MNTALLEIEAILSNVTAQLSMPIPNAEKAKRGIEVARQKLLDLTQNQSNDLTDRLNQPGWLANRTGTQTNDCGQRQQRARQRPGGDGDIEYPAGFHREDDSRWVEARPIRFSALRVVTFHGPPLIPTTNLQVLACHFSQHRFIP